MTPAGWIFMIVSWTVIGGLFIFCMYRTLRPRGKADNEDNKKGNTAGSEPMSPSHHS